MKTICWDVDDVLNSLMQEWFDHTYRTAQSSIGITYSDLTSNPPHEILGITLDEYIASIDAFRREHDSSLEPNWRLLEWFHSRGARYRHIALTARPLSETPRIAEWVFRFFGNYIRTFSVVPSRMDPKCTRYDVSKGGFLKWFGRVYMMVDDSTHNLSFAQHCGVYPVLFPQPWNSSKENVEEMIERINALLALPPPVNSNPPLVRPS